ncbi:hypothetical protein FSARC_9132 [Fusarium sarcochroum]|uniref:Uncharacterized protein n=1 Tax=Fusarium sarcochroum TaxID=1208366 RepID=A0A8H4X6E8_9HYPO|nr:hypothetical protein FSARC_9132 [Fusarium sarcochroum]
MPCCVAIIKYQQCQHSNLFKLGCTVGCTELCLEPCQQVLVKTHYLWSCEDCHQREYNKAEDARCLQWIDRTSEVSRQVASPNHQLLLDVLNSRELLEDRLCEKARVSQTEEIQWVAEWTLEYGLMLYDVVYKRLWDPRMAAARIKQLRALRLWDLVVVKDVLRNSKELEASQSHNSYCFIRDNLIEQRQTRRQSLRPPMPNRPPPPLFHEEKKPAPESNSSMGTDMTDSDESMGTEEGDQQTRGRKETPPPPVTNSSFQTSSLTEMDLDQTTEQDNEAGHESDGAAIDFD